MSAAYVRAYYAVDFKRGDRITMDGKPGTIVSFPGQYLGVRFDGETFTRRAHPTWRVERQTGAISDTLALYLLTAFTFVLCAAVIVLGEGWL